MNHSPAYVISRYLIAEGLVVDPPDSGSWKMYVGALPDGAETDHDAVAAIDTTPVKDGRLMDGDPLFHYGIQVLLRSSDYNEGYAKADAIAAALSAVDDEQVAIGGDTYEIANVTQATGVVVLGQEAGTKRRVMFSMNFLATMKEV